MTSILEEIEEMVQFVKSLFDTDRKSLKRYGELADKIETMADEYEALSDEDLKAKTPGLQHRLTNGETLDDILPEAFATRTIKIGDKSYQDSEPLMW